MENSKNKYSFDTAILKSLIEQGPGFVMELLRLGMNEAMKVEREQFLNAGAYQRTEARQGHANGFKPKTLNTGSGRVTFAIPQTRNCDFYPQSLQKGLRSERSLTMAMAEIRLFKERPLGCYCALRGRGIPACPYERFRGRCSRPAGRRDQCRGQAGSRRRVPQPGILRTSRWFPADGTARGMDGRQSLLNR